MAQTRKLPRTRIILTLTALLSAAAPSAPAAPGPHQPAPAAPGVQASDSGGLETLYEPGALLSDRNGDGHSDFVDACLALAATPSDAEVAAAADIAARLGFETASMDIPLPRHGADCPGIALAIGAQALADEAPADELEPGAGALTWSDGDTTIVRVDGGDDAGTRAAALALAGHLPYLWSPEGATLADVTAAVREVVTAAGLTAEAVRARRLLVRADAPGLDRAELELTVPAGDVARAAEALRAIAEAIRDRSDRPADESAPPAADEQAAARQQTAESAQQTGEARQETGGEEEPAASPSLRFEGLRMLRIAINDTDGTEDVVWVDNPHQVAAANGRRPGGGDKGDLDLSNLFTNDGFFADTDGNLIPDRVDVVLSPVGDTGAATADLAARLGLEATGITIPIAKTADEIDDPASEPPLVIIGARHPLIARLVDDEKIELPELGPGEGWIAVVRE
ncbi:MAG: hypothetical protein PVJ51_08610, partial [Acidobacteriota bacterium]